MNNSTELGWLAGIVDGEGTVDLYRQRKGVDKGFVISFSVSNTNYAIIVETHRILSNIVDDGSVRIMPIKPRQSHHRPQWRVHVTRRLSLYKVLDALIPYLVGKKPEAILLKQWCERRLMSAQGRLTEADFALVKQIEGIR